MHCTGAYRGDTLEQIGCLIASRLDAGRTRPDHAAALLATRDQRCKGIERRDLGQALAALANQINRGACEKYRDFQAPCQATVGDRERNRRQLRLDGPSTTSLSVSACIIVSLWIGVSPHPFIYVARWRTSLAEALKELVEKPLRPASNDPLQGDVLSNVLSTIRLSGSLQFCVMPTGAWQTDAEPSLAAAAGGSGHAIPFHIMVEGTCWLKMAGQETGLAAGDVVAPRSAPVTSLAPDWTVG
jgi:hypothetical protein